MSLYVALDHVAKGDSKVPFLLDTARWLKDLGFKVKWALAGREYYCFAALNALKAVGIDAITAAQDYPHLRKAKEACLSGRKGRVQAFTIKSGAKKGCKGQSLKCWLVIYPKDKYHLQAIRRDLRHGAMTLTGACERLHGLVTTAAPQGHGKKFPALIRSLYRTRWKIETGYRVADVKRCPWRSERDGTRFVDEMGRMFLLQDLWHLARVEDPRGDTLTLEMFRDDVVNKSTFQVNA